MFKKLFSPKQNDDPTLYEKSWGVFRLGRYSAWTILIVGTAFSFLVSNWIGNLFQTVIIAVFSSKVGFFSGNGLGFALHILNIELLNPQAFFGNEDLLSLLSFVNHFPAGIRYIIMQIFHWIGFLALEYMVAWRPFIHLWTKSRNLNQHEQGDSRIATPKEIRWQTFKVPDRNRNYFHHSGFPIMHKFNWKGKLNKAIKTQKGSIQNALGFSDLGLERLYQISLSFVLFIVVILGSSMVQGIVQFHRGKSVPIFSMFWISHPITVVAIWLFHFDVRLAILWGQLQVAVLQQPKPTLILFFLIEALLVLAILFHIQDVISAFKASWMYALFQEDIHQNFKDWRYKIHTNRNKLRKSSNDPTSYREKHLIFKVFSSYFHHPVKTAKLAYLEIAHILFPIEKGITGWYYLCPRPHNVLIYGTSGSGKGQMIVNPTMDINSRADPKYKPNMLVTDPKGESASGAYAMLKRRHYDVKVLNILDLSHSMSFNPLRLVIKYAQLGAVGQSAEACSQLSYTIYDPAGQGQNSYFYTSAASLFDAITFALLALAHSRYFGLDNLDYYDTGAKKIPVHDDGLGKGGNLISHGNHHIKKGKDGIYHSEVYSFAKISVRNISEMVSQLGGAEGKEADDDAPKKRLMIYFDHISEQLNQLRAKQEESLHNFSDVQADQLSILDQAVQKFQQSKMAGSKTAGSIYSTFMDRLRIYMEPDVAKMTSMDNFNPAEMGFDRLLRVQFNRRFKLQAITARSWRSKPKIDKRNKFGKPHYSNGYDNLEVNRSHLSEIGLADIPFSNPIPYNVFYVSIDLYDEIVNHYFHFVFKCIKQYYVPKTYEKLRNNYRTAPQVADIKECKAIPNPKNKYKVWIKRHKVMTVTNPIAKVADKAKKYVSRHHISKYLPCVIDKYTGEKVLNQKTQVKVKMVVYPQKKEYLAPKIAKSNLGRLAKNPGKAFIKQQVHFLFNPRPTAWFVVAPQNKQELNQLGTFAIDQTFNVLSNIAMKFTNGRHVQRPLQMILDELGNLPAIPHLDRKASFGRSQHIYLMPIFQAREQADKIYKKDVTNIVFDNCPTTVYILSNSSDTIKEISDGFGNRTITNTTRSYDPAKLKSINYNENEVQQKVMMPDKLKNLKLGETAILRKTDRVNIWGEDTRPWPVFDTGEFILPYSWWFLGGSFRKGSLGSVPIVTPHKYLNLESLTIQFGHIYDWLEAHHNLDVSLFDKEVQPLKAKIEKFKNVDYQLLYYDEIEFAVDDKKDNKPEEALQWLFQVPQQMQRDRVIPHMATVIQVGQYLLFGLANMPDIQTLYHNRYAPLIEINSVFTIVSGALTKIKRQGILSDFMNHPESYGYVGQSLSGCRALNEYAESYLTDVGLIDGDNNLTAKALYFINRPETLKEIIDLYSRDFHSNIPLYKFVYQILYSLKASQKHDKSYIGLNFLLSLMNYKRWRAFATPKRYDKKDKHYDQKDTDMLNDKTVELISVNIYICSILGLMDSIVTRNDSKLVSNKLRHFSFRVSNPYKSLLNKLNSFNKNINA